MSHLFTFVLLGASLLAASAAPAAPQREIMGMVIRDPWYDFGTHPGFPGEPNYVFQDTMGENLAQAGVRWVRLDFHIPVPIGGPQDAVMAEIAKNDYFINIVAPRHNFKVLALLNYSLIEGTDMRLLNSGPFTVTSEYGGGVNQYMDTWLSRALMIANRYREKIAAYEVLNEENRLPTSDAIAPEIVARMLTKFYRFCKNIDPSDRNNGCVPGTSIILGGLHPRGTGDPANPDRTVMTDEEYLRRIYDINNPSGPFVSFRNRYGLGYPVDGIGYHPYPEEIRLSLADVRIDTRLDRIRQVLIELGDSNRPFWITEIGYNIAFYKNSPAGQAPFMRDVYTSLAARRLPNGEPEVATVFWFKYEDFPPASGPNAQKWGVVRIPFVEGNCPGGACYDPSGQPQFYRPSFLTYRELAGLPIVRSFAPLTMRP